jgi:hypothetical protein
MKLTNLQILSLAEAITHLDGQQLTQVIEGKAVALFKSYRLHHAARWLLACAQGKLQAVIADFNRAKDALIKHHTGGANAISPAHANFNQFVEDLEKLKQEAVELNLDQIALDQLKLEENEKAGNELPIAVLNALAPLIKTN